MIVVADGTAALHFADGAVQLRAPDAPGHGRWRPLTLDGAQVIRVLPGGDVIALVGEPMALVRASPGTTPVTLASGIELTEPATSFEIVDGTAQLDFESGTRTIYDDGTLR